jgi:hypothetical protein
LDIQETRGLGSPGAPAASKRRARRVQRFVTAGHQGKT